MNIHNETICIIFLSIMFFTASCSKTKRYEVKAHAIPSRESVVLIPMQQNGKWGYVDSLRKWIIEPQYTYASIFRSGIGIVSIDSKHSGLINSKGEWILEPVFTSADILENGDSILFLVAQDGQNHVLNQSGEIIISRPSSSIISLSSYREGLMLTMDEETGLFGFIDEKGNWVIKPQYYFGSNFSEGLASVSIDTQRLFINHQNEVVLRLPEDISYASEFSDGLSAVCKNGKYGYINKEGEFVIDFKYDNADDFSGGWAAVSVGNDSTMFIDTAGNTLFSLNCESTMPYATDYKLVFKNKKVGLVDKHANFLLPIKYDNISDNVNNFVRVKEGKQEYYIDFKNNIEYR